MEDCTTSQTELSVLSDDELIDRSRRADHAAYHELIDRYKSIGYRTAVHVLRHPSDAEDALQEAFTKAYIHLDSYSNHYRFYTWFSTIVRNVALSHLRARDWLVTSQVDEIAIPVRSLIEDSPELAALSAHRAEELREAVSLLPERYRRVLELRYWSDLSYEEIATVTKQSLGAVKTQIRRAKAMLSDGLRATEFGLLRD
jgi:RNA polymerase sigma factor (sigma-70 family)